MSPQELRQAADQLALVAGDLEQAADRHRGVSTSLRTTVAGIPDAWTSPVATQLHGEASSFLSAIAGAPDALATGSGALRALGTTASALAAELQRHLDAAAAATAAAASARSQLGTIPPEDHEMRRLLQRREADQLGAARVAESGIEEVTARWDVACRPCASTLESSMAGLGAALLGPQAAPTGSAPGGSSEASVAAQLWAFLLGDVAAIWGGTDDVLPLGSGLAGLVRMVRMAGWARAGGLPVDFPTFANGGVGRFLSNRVPALGFLANPATQAVLTRLSVVGGLYTGVTGSIDLWQHGNPVTAVSDHGAGYTADVGRTVFGFGTAGLGVLAVAGVAAPPVLVIVTVGAGVVWVGSEVVEHWDDITGWAGDRWDDVSGFAGDRWDDVTGFVGDVRDGTGQVLATVGDGVGHLASGARDLAGSVGDGIGDLASGALDVADDLPLVGGLFG